MNRKADYFARYDAIAAVSGRMLQAARDADWSAVSQLQDEYRRLVGGLKEAAAGVVLDQAELSRKLQLIRRILADDAAIRELASPEIARLSSLIEVQRSTQVVQDLYRARV